MQPPPRVNEAWARLRALPPWVGDAVLATSFVVLGFASTSEPSSNGIAYDPRDAWAYVLILLTTVPYYFRRRAPLAVLVVSVAAVVVLSDSGYAEGVLPIVVLFGAYTVGSHRPAREAVAAAIAVGVGLLALFIGNSRGFDAGNLAGNAAMFGAAILLGRNVQSRRLRLEALEHGAEAAAQRAAADERLRIAQELHDVVAHSLGVIAVQAGMGAHVIDTDPAEAKRALEHISETSRASLAEIRRLLGVVRGREDAPEYTPAPSLAQLPDLVRDLDRAGLPVDLTTEGDLGDLPPGVELAAYRIVQEALTNALRHAGAARATVRLQNTGHRLDLEVTDDGRGSDGTSTPGGHGLVGMRERAALYGGTVDAGPRPGGGYRVAASLPYEEAAAR